MVSKTNEQALESAIEKHLTGTCLEELKNMVRETPAYANTHLYKIGQASDFNPQYAIDTEHFWSFLKSTQEKELDKLKANSPGVIKSEVKCKIYSISY